MMEPMLHGPVALFALFAVLLVGCEPAPRAQVVEVGDSPSIGPEDAKVVVVEFGDFQCPACGKEAATVKSLRDAYQDRVRFVFKQFPLSFHQYAQLAAEASLAANAQGQFWEYSDTLFAHQANLARVDLESHARQLTLDMTAFTVALDEHRFADAVAADASQGTRLGVRATPTFFVNGHGEAGAASYQRLSELIEAELSN
jgi:protein-disulfide isomerase